jgi:hypothetical protein
MLAEYGYTSLERGNRLLCVPGVWRRDDHAIEVVTLEQRRERIGSAGYRGKAAVRVAYRLFGQISDGRHRSDTARRDRTEAMTADPTSSEKSESWNGRRL